MKLHKFRIGDHGTGPCCYCYTFAPRFLGVRGDGVDLACAACGKHDGPRGQHQARLARLADTVKSAGVSAIAAEHWYFIELEGALSADELARLKDLLGIAGTLPTEPVVGYLARSASVMYALHGLVVFYVSFDLPRYWTLIRLLAITAIVHGALMSLIDYRVGMPGWWSLLEGPCFAATGAAALALQALAGRPAERT